MYAGLNGPGAARECGDDRETLTFWVRTKLASL